jgi:hypothetical protein
MRHEFKHRHQGGIFNLHPKQKTAHLGGVFFHQRGETMKKNTFADTGVH